MIRISARALPHERVFLLGSSDMYLWQQADSQVADENGNLEFTDSAPGRHANRYYQMISAKLMYPTQEPFDIPVSLANYTMAATPSGTFLALTFEFAADGASYTFRNRGNITETGHYTYSRSGENVATVVLLSSNGEDPQSVTFTFFTPTLGTYRIVRSNGVETGSFAILTE